MTNPIVFMKVFSCRMERYLSTHFVFIELKNNYCLKIKDFSFLFVIGCSNSRSLKLLNFRLYTLHLIMASCSENSGKTERLYLLEIEENIFLEAILKSSCADIIAEAIYEIIKDAVEISDSLKNLYRQGIFGTDKKIKKWLRNRMYAIRRKNKWVSKCF